MKKKDIITWGILMLLTVATAVLSKFQGDLQYIMVLTLLLSAVKFLGVSFQFMELKKAHVLWKTLVIGFLAIFVGIIWVLV